MAMDSGHLVPIAGISLLFGVFQFAFLTLRKPHREGKLWLHLLDFPVAFGFPMSVGVAWLESVVHYETDFLGRFVSLWGMFLVLGGLIEAAGWWLRSRRS